jgi:hypothetical protein
LLTQDGKSGVSRTRLAISVTRAFSFETESRGMGRARGVVDVIKPESRRCA